MFNFYLIFTGHDVITDAGRATTCKRNFKAPWLHTEVQKMKPLSKTLVLTGKQFEDFRQKKNRNKIHDLSENSAEHKEPKRINWTCPSYTVRIKLNRTWRKMEFRSKPLRLCKIRIKKSSLDMLNYYVISAGRDMFNDWHWQVYHVSEQTQSSTITKKNTKNEGLSENIGFTK